MKIFKNLFLKKIKKIDKDKKNNNFIFNRYFEIGKLVREARLQKNLSMAELAFSKVLQASKTCAFFSARALAV